MSIAWLQLASAIVCEVIATSALRACNGFSRSGPSLIALVGYAAAFYALSLALNEIPLGIAYAIWCGVGLVLIALVSVVIYGQSLDAGAIAGITLIGLGVLTINLFSSTTVR